MPSFLFTCFVNHQGGKRKLQARQRKVEQKSGKSMATDWTGYNEANKDMEFEDGTCSQGLQTEAFSVFEKMNFTLTLQMQNQTTKFDKCLITGKHVRF